MKQPTEFTKLKVKELEEQTKELPKQVKELEEQNTDFTENVKSLKRRTRSLRNSKQVLTPLWSRQCCPSFQQRKPRRTSRR